LVRHEPVTHIVWHMTGLMVGAVPPFMAAGIYACLNHLGWGEHTYVVVLALVLWTLTPLGLKALGGRIWVKASPAAPAMGRIFWVYYCEVAFSCFGFAVFSRSPASSIGYAFTLVPLLALQVLRGAQRGFDLAPCMGTMTLHRLVLYLDTFAAVMGRVAAYTLHVCFGILKLSWPEQKDVIVSRPSLLRDVRIRATYTVNLFNDQDVDLLSLSIGFVGLVIVSSSFVVFSLLLPRAWSAQTLVSKTAWGEEGATVASTSASSQRPTAADEEAAPVPRRSGRTSSWLHGESRSTMDAQHGVVTKFMGDYLRFMVLALLFVFSLSTLMVNLVLSIRYRREGPDCSVP